MPYPFNVTPASLPNAYDANLAVGANQEPVQHDATAEFNQALNDPSRWIIKQGVPVFKAHERVDPATNKLIKVDLSKLYRIANNMSRLERGGVPIRMTIGHTEPGKPEHRQPPVCGYYRNPRVQPFGPKGEPAVVVDEWLDPQFGQQRKNTPYRSAEYYDDAEQITGVALLTRDPYLDLGVVAYQRGDRPINCSTDDGLIAYTGPSPLATLYAANPATGRAPVMYRLTLGELPMNPPGIPNPQQIPPQYPQPQPTPYAATIPTPGMPPTVPYYGPPAAAYPYPYPAPPPGYANPPAQYPAPQAPVPYGSMHRPPTRNTWLYGRQSGTPYDGPGDMAGGGGGGGGMGALQAVYEGLSQALQALQSVMEGASAAPQSPFPEGGGGGMDGNPMTPAARYAMGGGRPGTAPPRRPDPRQGRPPQYARYERGQEPLRTISGQPVGQQLFYDRLNAQIHAQNQALRMLFYERDQRDSEACFAEIRRLVQEGYAVGEEELRDLKAKRPEERPAFLQNIATKYQKVPTDVPPPIPGDPTSAPEMDPNNGPISKEQMEQALKYAAANPNDPNGYNNALQYMRSGGQASQPSMYNHPALAGIAPFRRSFPPPEAAAGMMPPADFGEPYPEFSPNGQY